MPRHLTRLFAVACIESRLPATSLTIVKLDLTANTSKDFNTTGAYAAPKLVDQAGDEEGNLHEKLGLWSLVFGLCPPNHWSEVQSPKSKGQRPKAQGPLSYRTTTPFT